MNVSFIQSKIYEIRNQKVMLDFDLAELYKVETKMLKRAIKRNINRFPPDFMFELIPEEYTSLRYQIGTLKRGGHAKYMPFAFTEHGVTMLASVLQSDKAVQMNIAIVRAFVELRQIITKNVTLSEQLLQFRQELSQRIDEHDVQLRAIYDAIENLLDEKAETRKWDDRNRIGFTKNV